MKRFRSPGSLQSWCLQKRLENNPIALVPTMGFLHAGHVSLIRKARKAAGPTGIVIVTLYVNPTQFGQGEDFDAYPRDLQRDLAICQSEGVNAVFTPSHASMYASPYSTYVNETLLSRQWEGIQRPSHFRGVTTIVSKLFLLTQPHVAVFGEKDFQQAMIIRQMTRDLHFPIRILLGATLREKDGLAMSSRNAYLTENQRGQAKVLYQMIQLARKELRLDPHRKWTSSRLGTVTQKLLQATPLIRLDYMAFVDPHTLQQAKTIRKGIRMLLAAYAGKTRLIDNGSL
ncbi:MAG: pantoate--beta-alanine ligase [Verrucomicrobiales bacterium]|jgi:pantoate--beta-alanine ligase